VLLDVEIEATTESQALFAGIVQYATRVAAGTTPPTFARDWVIAGSRSRGAPTSAAGHGSGTAHVTSNDFDMPWRKWGLPSPRRQEAEQHVFAGRQVTVKYTDVPLPSGHAPQRMRGRGPCIFGIQLSRSFAVFPASRQKQQLVRCPALVSTLIVCVPAVSGCDRSNL